MPMDIEGDAFGKIYEYFLGKFALAEGQGGGEFFTPRSVVRLMVEIIEPHGGTVFDPFGGAGTTALVALKHGRNAILSELKQCFEIHQREGSRLGGVHFELTGEDVTECTGGSLGIREADLVRNYETFCDPRLNYSQSLEMAFLISSILHQRRG